MFHSTIVSPKFKTRNNLSYILISILFLTLMMNTVGNTSLNYLQFSESFTNLVTKINKVQKSIMFVFLSDPTTSSHTINISIYNHLNFTSFKEPQLIFTNASAMPHRSSYFPGELVSSITIGKFLPSFVKLIKLVTFENFNISTNLSFQFASRVDYDIFIILGEEKILRQYFLTPFGLKLRNRIGVIYNPLNEKKHTLNYLVNPLIFNNGTMNLTQVTPNLTQFSLNGRILRVSANTLAPYIIYHSATNISGGTHYKMLTLSAATYNFSLTWDISSTRGNGKLGKDGKASGMLGDVLSGKADIAFIARLTRGQVGVIDLTTSNYVDTLVFITRKPEAYLEWTAIIRLFTIGTWVTIFLVLLTLVPLYYLKLQRSYSSATPFKAFLIPFAILISQSVPKIPERGYLLTLFWMIFVLNLNIAYNSNLSSFLTKLEPESVPNSFEDLSQRLDYNISFNYLNNGSCDCFHFFNDSTNPMIIGIKDRFMRNLVANTGQCIVRAIVKRKNVCIGWESVTKIGIAHNATLHAGLKLVIISRSVHSSLNSIGFERHSIYTKKFDRIFGWFRDMGIVVHFKREAEAGALNSGQSWLQDNKNLKIYKVLRKFVDDLQVSVRPFQIVHFTFAYILLFGGSILSCISFLIEHIVMANRKTRVKIVILTEYIP